MLDVTIMYDIYMNTFSCFSTPMKIKIFKILSIFVTSDSYILYYQVIGILWTKHNRSSSIKNIYRNRFLFSSIRGPQILTRVFCHLMETCYYNIKCINASILSPLYATLSNARRLLFVRFLLVSLVVLRFVLWFCFSLLS